MPSEYGLDINETITGPTAKTEYYSDWLEVGLNLWVVFWIYCNNYSGNNSLAGAYLQVNQDPEVTIQEYTSRVRSNFCVNLTQYEKTDQFRMHFSLRSPHQTGDPKAILYWPALIRIKTN